MKKEPKGRIRREENGTDQYLKQTHLGKFCSDMISPGFRALRLRCHVSHQLVVCAFKGFDATRGVVRGVGGGNDHFVQCASAFIKPDSRYMDVLKTERKKIIRAIKNQESDTQNKGAAQF